VSPDATAAGTLTAEVAAQYGELADLLESARPDAWDAPSLCERWRTREVVAHVTMPARYSTTQFMAELQAAGGDFTRLSDRVAARDGALPAASLVADLRAEALHAWQPPGGGVEGALTHCVIHTLDITEALRWDYRVPAGRIGAVLEIIGGPDAPNLFGVDLTGVRLQADDLEWSYGAGDEVRGPAQALALVLCGRAVPAGRLSGPGASRFSSG
jgi:uncharacterized protein (TIGR03083 family)